ncbi:MAG TPA: NADH-quinone oxidoreductase subunit I [Candidatus Dormibacteraeota bacterium]|nr:NADH-quinone oxidoreductase subunit I [Candidatus Dormibacteraeota bacterium]
MLKELGKGLAFTLKATMQKPITLQWPEEQKPAPARHRGRHILHRYDNGMEKCIGCELCSAACPVGCIYVVPAENDPASPVSPGERYAIRYEINLVRCIYCGYCAEACPTEAITLGPRFDLADYRRERFVATKQDLLEAWPHFEQGAAANPAGAGADQRGMAGHAPGVDARTAWESRVGADAPEGSEDTHTGTAGLAPRVPTVAPPPKGPGAA